LVHVGDHGGLARLRNDGLREDERRGRQQARHK
jgi:hypothetical protein